MSFDGWNHKLATFVVEWFGRLREEGSRFIVQLAASVVEGRDGRPLAKKGIYKEHIFLQLVSVTTQVVISKRASRFKHLMRGR